ncbi:hypothetical protein AK812_SmicGene24344 [Symbiodinium microadriaticum]|uniref:Uncharacterized protein n=1 Tax=Symbiodinium microadriaticum TaxID=2951 RepID=A0A1Q9DEY4_SYMMI|nr:hypothetical protein AK812_SmicGene24344 [Symbiodinium microadriaticum]
MHSESIWMNLALSANVAKLFRSTATMICYDQRCTAETTEPKQANTTTVAASAVGNISTTSTTSTTSHSHNQNDNDNDHHNDDNSNDDYNNHDKKKKEKKHDNVDATRQTIVLIQVMAMNRKLFTNLPVKYPMLTPVH